MVFIFLGICWALKKNRPRIRSFVGFIARHCEGKSSGIFVFEFRSSVFSTYGFEILKFSLASSSFFATESCAFGFLLVDL